jgi:putative ABC transport system permease protein
MSSWLSDLRLAFRTLARAPFLTGAAVLSLALGLAANITVFSWVQGLILKPLAGVTDQSRLLILDGVSRGGVDQRLSYPDYRDLRDRLTVFSGVFAHGMQPLGLSRDERAERVWGEIVSGRFFEVLGVEAAIGRRLGPEDDRLPGAHPVVVLSHAFWERRFESDPRVVGKTVQLNGVTFTIVGVAPKGFSGAVTSLSMDVFVPVMMQEQVVPGGSRFEARDVHWLGAMGRLKPGAGIGEARAELESLSAELGREHPKTNEGARIDAFPLWDAPFGATNLMRPVLATLGGVIAMSLLIACANVANLLLARSVDRRREMTTRLSLGATRWRLVRQLLVESLLLAFAAGAAGTVASVWSSGLLRAFVPPTSFPIGLTFSIDGRALAFAVLLSGVTGVLFGLVPALGTSRAGIAGALREDARAVVGGARSRFRSILVVAQVAVASVLLAAAGLFLQALSAARNLDPGFEPEGLVLASIDLFPQGYSDDRGRAFFRELLARVGALPGVDSVSVARRLPLDFGKFETIDVQIPGYTPAKNEDVSFGINRVGARYLETMRIPLASGRDFTVDDRENAPTVAVINETAARRYWKDRDPIGERLMAEGRSFTVVGVARDGKYSDLTEAPRPYLYLPVMQSFAPALVVHVRSHAGLEGLAAALRREVQALDPAVPLFDVRPMSEHMGIPVFLYRLAAVLLASFGALALLLTAIGLYGVIAYGVRRRRPELALRMALGASGHDVVRMVVWQGMRLTLFGLVIGLGGALVLTRLTRSLLVGVETSAPGTVAIATLLLAGVALAATYLPAREASRTAPLETLRYE